MPESLALIPEPLAEFRILEIMGSSLRPWPDLSYFSRNARYFFTRLATRPMSCPVPRPRRLTVLSSAVFAAIFSLACLTACNQNPYLAGNGTAMNGGPGSWGAPATSPQVAANEARISELSRRVQLLDDNNRQLHTQLAQSEQQSRVFQDESRLLREQLADVSGRLQSTSIAAQQAESQVRGMQASVPMRSGAAIRANTNMAQSSVRLNAGGLPVENDGDVVRVIVPSDRLFAPGTAMLHAQAGPTLDPIVSQIKALYPRNRVGIESYTDDGSMVGVPNAGAHELTSAQATSVLNHMTTRGGLPPAQLFTVAQGSNNPRQTNHTPAGRAANRRVELVIYPE
jgi:flagellar motor protein MotB